MIIRARMNAAEHNESVTVNSHGLLHYIKKHCRMSETNGSSYCSVAGSPRSIEFHNFVPKTQYCLHATGELLNQGVFWKFHIQCDEKGVKWSWAEFIEQNITILGTTLAPLKGLVQMSLIVTSSRYYWHHWLLIKRNIREVYHVVNCNQRAFSESHASLAVPFRSLDFLAETSSTERL